MPGSPVSVHVGAGRPHGVGRGLAHRGEQALARVRGGLRQRNPQCHRRCGVVQTGDLRLLFRRQRVEMSLQLQPLVRVERTDRIGQDQGLELVGDHMACSRWSRSAARPVRMRVFTVPSGTPNRVASSLWV